MGVGLRVTGKGSKTLALGEADLSFRNEGGLGTVMRPFPANAQAKGVVDLQVKQRVAGPGPETTTG